MLLVVPEVSTKRPGDTLTLRLSTRSSARRLRRRRGLGSARRSRARPPAVRRGHLVQGRRRASGVGRSGGAGRGGMCGCERASSAAPGPQRLTLAAPLCPAEPLRSTSPTLSFAPLRPADQGMYRAIVQHGPFSDDGTADRFDISAPASVFVDDGAGGGGAGDACAVCLLPAGSAAEGGAAAASPPFRFARRVDESFTNGWRELAAADGRLLGGDLVFCDHPLHTPCAKAYAQNLILKQGRARVRCPAPGCPHTMGGADVEVLFGAGSPVAAAFASALTRSHGERLAAVAAGEADTATLSLLRDTASVCPGCKVILVKEAGCATVVCAMCDARFVAATHKFGAPAAAAATGKQ